MTRLEVGRIVYNPHGSRLLCVCGIARVDVSFFFACDRTGNLDVIDGCCFRCWECGRVYSADGVVLTRIEVRT